MSLPRGRRRLNGRTLCPELQAVCPQRVCVYMPVQFSVGRASDLVVSTSGTRRSREGTGSCTESRALVARVRTTRRRRLQKNRRTSKTTPPDVVLSEYTSVALSQIQCRISTYPSRRPPAALVLRRATIAEDKGMQPRNPCPEQGTFATLVSAGQLFA